MTIKAAISTLAAQFVEDVLTAVRGAALGELMGGDLTVSKPPSTSRDEAAPRHYSKRMTTKQAASTIAKIVTLLKEGNPRGLRSEEIRAALDLSKRTLPRVLKLAVATGSIKVLGGKSRATVYGVGAAAKKPVKKAPVKKAPKVKAKAKAAPKRAKTAKAKARPIAKAKPRKASAKPKASAKKTSPETVNGVPPAEAAPAAE